MSYLAMPEVTLDTGGFVLYCVSALSVKVLDITPAYLLGWEQDNFQIDVI